MKKKLYYIKGMSYNHVVSVPEDPEYPIMYSYMMDEIYDALVDPVTGQELEEEDLPAAAAKFLAEIEDDSSWIEAEDDGIFEQLIAEDDGIILAVYETDVL